MTTLTFSELMIVTGVIIALSVIYLYIGYWMGRNSAERPFNASEKEKPFDPGPTDEPEGDYFLDELPDYGETTGRVPTVKEG